MSVGRYLLSLPERLVRSTLGVTAGVAREVGELALPEGVRRTQLYQNIVDTTLRFVIEHVGGAEGVYPDEAALPEDFLKRRTAGNAIELLGIVALRASPVWVLAAMADASGFGRVLVPEIATALKEQGLLDPGGQFTTVDEMLNGLERTSSRLASTMNTPPLDVASLRADLQAIRDEARGLKPASLPSRESITGAWTQLKTVSEQQQRSIFETSSMIALTAASRTTRLVGESLIGHYRETLTEIQQQGYVAYATTQMRPYIRAALTQFTPSRPTLTQRLLDWRAARKNRGPTRSPRHGL
ncbi:MAG: hypothetical protein ACRD1U_17250 [Vicinamibacterales bacterium]